MKHYFGQPMLSRTKDCFGIWRLTMQNILSPAFAEKISNLLNAIKDDEHSKKLLLQDPATFLEKNQIFLVNCQVIVEENPGYGLYFAIQSKKIIPSPDQATQSKDETFRDHHFRDCLFY